MKISVQSKNSRTDVELRIFTKIPYSISHQKYEEIKAHLEKLDNILFGEEENGEEEKAATTSDNAGEN